MLLNQSVYVQQNMNVFDFLMKFVCDYCFAIKVLTMLQSPQVCPQLWPLVYN